MGTIFARTLILYLVVLIALRLMGKREIGQLQPYELVVSIMIADLASVPMQDVGIPLVQGIIPILALLVGQIVMSYLNIKSGVARRLICGRPTLLIQKGKIVEKNLRNQKYTIDGLLTELRVKGYFDISSIEYAVLETSGELSVLVKDENAPTTKKDMNVPAKYTGFPRALMIDGSYIDDNIKIMGYTRDKVDEFLRSNNVKMNDVFLLIMDESKKAFIQEREK